MSQINSRIGVAAISFRFSMFQHKLESTICITVSVAEWSGSNWHRRLDWNGVGCCRGVWMSVVLPSDLKICSNVIVLGTVPNFPPCMPLAHGMHIDKILPKRNLGTAFFLRSGLLHFCAIVNHRRRRLSGEFLKRQLRSRSQSRAFQISNSRD